MFLKNIKLNWKAGLTVALISIPLSISLAMASQSSPVAGIITAIIAGLIGAIFGGGEYNVIGPTGALSGVIAGFALINGAELVPALTLIAGFVILIGYFLHVEKYLVLIPSSVIHGFTFGIAVILILNQADFIFGLNHLPQKSNVIENMMVVIPNYKIIDWTTVLAFALFLSSLFILRRFKSPIPGAIILAPIAIAIGFLAKTGYIPNLSFYTLGDRFGDISLVFTHISKFTINKQLIYTAITVSFIAIIETMLSAKIGDKMTDTKHNPRKELLSLGLANIGSGLLGGIPATAALARTSLNIKSGATHRSSGVMSVVFITLISFFLLSYFKFIPMVAISAILVDVALQMIETKHFRKFWKYEKNSLYIAFFVAAGTVIEDPIVGVFVGVAVTLVLFIEKMSRGHFEVSINNETGIVTSFSGDKLKPLKEDGSILLYSIRGNLLYINCKAHLARFESNTFDNYKTVIFRLREVYMIDLDGIEALDEMIHILKSKNIVVFITSVSDSLRKKLRRSSHEFIYMENHGLVFDKTRYALSSIGLNSTVE